MLSRGGIGPMIFFQDIWKVHFWNLIPNTMYSGLNEMSIDILLFFLLLDIMTQREVLMNKGNDRQGVIIPFFSVLSHWVAFQ